MDVSGTAMAGDTKGTSYRKELTPRSEPLARGQDARALWLSGSQFRRMWALTCHRLGFRPTALLNVFLCIYQDGYGKARLVLFKLLL